MASDTESWPRGAIPAGTLLPDCEPIDLDRAARDPAYRRIAIERLAAEEEARHATPPSPPKPG